jgi:hypothetical protein
MKKLIPILLLISVCIGRAAVISFTMTNSIGLPDTNLIKVFSCGPVQANGSAYTTGIGYRVQPNANGYAQIWLEQNNYLATNAYLGRGYIFRAPLDASHNNVYASAGPSCLISGLNYFVNLTVGSSTNLPVTLNQITNSLGFMPADFPGVTNIAQSVTNGFTSIVFSNPASFTSAQTVTGIVQSLSPSYSQATNIAGAIGSNLVSGYTLTNTFGSFTNWSVTNTVAQIAASGANGSNFTLLTSNSLQASSLVQLNAASNALQSAQNASNAATASNLASTSNALWWAKQPASTTLSNLAQTGAWTNMLTAGTNVVLSTNLTAPIVYVNVPLQTQLTNGMTSIVFSNPAALLFTNALPALTNGFVQASITNGLASTSALTNYYLNSNPSNYVTASITNGITIPPTNGFVGASVTNGLASTNWVASNFETNGESLTIANQQISARAFTNQLAAGTNVTLSTNLTGPIVYVNASPQTFLTNGLAQTNWVSSNFDTNGAGIAAALQSGANGSNYSAQLYSSSTNYANTNALAILGGSSTNFVASTNGTANNLTVNGYVSILGYLGLSGPIYSTNLTWQITNSIHNATNGFAGASVTNFTLSGYVGGFTTNNSFTSSASNSIINLIAQYGVNPTNGISAATATNISASLIADATNSLWSGATNTFYFNSNPSNFTTFQVVTNLIQQATNGISGGSGATLAQVTNIASSLISTATNTLWGAVTNQGGVLWGGLTNKTSLARPATLYYFVTNNIPQYGILYTN